SGVDVLGQQNAELPCHSRGLSDRTQDGCSQAKRCSFLVAVLGLDRCAAHRHRRITRSHDLVGVPGTCGSLSTSLRPPVGSNPPSALASDHLSIYARAVATPAYGLAS